MFDLIIIGSGPAGANLARLIGNDPQTNYKTAIIDKRALDQPSDQRRIKSCGGLLSPDAQNMLAKLELSLPPDLIDSPQFFKVRTLDFDNQIECDYQRHYYNIDREKFDRYLYHLIPDNIKKITDTLVKSIDQMDGYWEIELVHQGETYRLQTKCLIAADGANSFTRRKVVKFSNEANYFSIQKSYHVNQKLPYFVGIFDSEVTDYYSWMIQKKDTILLGTALPRSEQQPHLKFELLKQKVSAFMGLDLEVECATEGAFIERTLSPSDLIFTYQSRALNGSKLPLALIGEAAGATSPTSAEGISYALKTSNALYKALSLSKDHHYTVVLNRYEKYCNTIRTNIAFKNLKSPAMYHKIVRGLVMRSGLSAIKKEKGPSLQRKVLYKI